MARSLVPDLGDTEDSHTNLSEDDEDDTEDCVDFEEDVFSLFISAAAEDLYQNKVQWGRSPLLWVLLMSCIGLQVFFVRAVQRFPTMRAVYEIQVAYSKFEFAMYGNDSAHCQETVNGFCRGMPGFFDASKFDTLDDDLKLTICHIPLAHPIFCSTILVLWAISVFGQIRKVTALFRAVICRTQTSSDGRQVYTNVGNERAAQNCIISQLPIRSKVLWSLFVFLPRFCIDVCLLWVGSRWLLATTNFTDLILNAVALVFIMDLGRIAYITIAPGHNKSVLRATKVFDVTKDAPPCVSAITWGAVVFGWVFLFMFYLQNVLPDYRWDVSAVCESFLEEHYALSKKSFWEEH